MTVVEMKNLEWILNKDNGLIFVKHDLLQNNVRFVSYSPTDEEIIAGHQIIQSAPIPCLDSEDTPETDEKEGEPETDAPFDVRLAAIKAAVHAVPVENYGKAGFGFPAMPKVADIETATGITDVTRAEVAAALEGA